MDFNDLDKDEKAVVRALMRLGARWPKALSLTVFEETVHVTGYGGDLVLPIPAIPAEDNYEDEAPAGRKWDYEFTLLGWALEPVRQRAVMTETQFQLFREGFEARAGQVSYISRRPWLPPERVK
jgi:hypothetical protein